MAIGSTSLGEAVLDVRADTTGFNRDLDKAEKKTKGSMLAMGKSVRGLAAGAGFGALAAGIWKTVGAGSDLQESLNKSRVTFGAAAKDMPGFGQSVADSLGMSRAAALDAAAGIGAMLQPMGLSQKESAKMSARMTTLAADLGSFHNADPTDMLQRLRAGLSGEAEGLKQFGIVLTEGRVKQEAYRMGLAATGAELTDQQKIQARYSLALRDAGRANGDFARTSGGMANQQRILKAEMADLTASVGGALVPAFTAGIQGLRAMIGFLSEHQGTIKAVASAIRDGLARAWQAAMQAVDAAMPTFRNIVTTVQSVVRTIQALWDRFGQHILGVVREVFGIVRTYVEGVLKGLRDVINLVLALIRGDWGEAWAALKSLASNAITTAATIIKKLVTGLGPAVGRLALAAALAIGGKLVQGLLNGLRGIASLPARLWTGVSGAIGSTASSALNGAAAIGRAIVDGAIQGAGNLASRLKDWVEDQVRSALSSLNPFSPVEHGGRKFIGYPIMDGAAKGILERSGKMRAALDAVVVGAVRSAQANLASMARDLAGSAAAVIDARMTKRVGALGDSDDAKRLAEIEGQQATTATARQERDLRKAVDDASLALTTATVDERIEAQERLTAALVALSDWQLEQEAAALRQRLTDAEAAITDEETARKDSIDRQLADLTYQYNAGLLSQKDYMAKVNAELRAADVDFATAGQYLGQAFAASYLATLEGVGQQAAKLIGFGAGGGGADVQDPFAVQVEQWRKREAALVKERDRLQKVVDKPLPKDATAKAKADRAEAVKDLKRISDLLRVHRANQPKRLALGGILDRPTLAWVAEAGVPEAAIPLNGSPRSWGLLNEASRRMREKSPPGAMGAPRSGGLVNIEQMSVRAPEDAQLVAARLSRELARGGVA